MTKDPAVVAVYGTHAAAEAAVDQLQRAGFDLKKLSIVGKDYHTEAHVVGYYNTGDRVRYWGKLGAFGEACGVCSSDGPFSSYRELARCSWPALSSPALSRRWRGRW
jgi:hypothetical protein